jgi:hypothetical protein
MRHIAHGACTDFIGQLSGFFGQFLKSGHLHAAIVVEIDVKLMQKGRASLPGPAFSFEL